MDSTVRSFVVLLAILGLFLGAMVMVVRRFKSPAIQQTSITPAPPGQAPVKEPTSHNDALQDVKELSRQIDAAWHLNLTPEARPAAQAELLDLRSRILGIADTNARTALFFNLANHQSLEGFYEDYFQTAAMIDDVELRESNLREAGRSIKDREIAKRALLKAQSDTMGIFDLDKRNAEYAQLVYVMQFRGFQEEMRATCNMISRPEIRPLVCR
jgi:hypothetical protein